ncbi:Cytochrome c [Stieleria neptunia]|uniref:Cytochrome c n=2 Tax=Stieleria neptunia TaxID=2527979 RepID=A0A518HMQ7_9BACT|nr:Cytochrome c [Stieleria neptunia]
MRFVMMVGLVVFASSLQSAEQDKAKSALEAIESNRGGRHWVEQETAPPKSPADSLSAIRIEPGYEISLFAAEPLVRDPVAICFDRHGDMYVVEYGDYPIGPEDGGDPLSKIVMLEDSDGDGIADRRHVFADKLDFAHSMMAYQGGLLVGAKTKVLYLKDTDGDHVADVRETVFDGFTPAHPQMQIGNPRWGIDNWVYLNYGPGKITSATDPDSAVALPRKDFRFHPQTMEFEADSGMGQFGNTVDRWGHRFYCTNRNPIITTFLAPNVMARNPFHIVSAPYYDVAPSGGQSHVFPLVAMKSNYLSHAGTHTSACGTTAYTGDLGDETFRNSVLVCEPIGHLVTRSIVDTDSLKFTAKRAQPKSDFVASADTWFRPSSLATGPDGALYLADMYRLWVEHPKFLPPEIAAKLDWRAGDDRGRIYRIVPSGSAARPFTAPESDADCVALLADDNGWRQFLGQRLLVEQQATGQAASLRKLLASEAPTTRLHALWTLDGLSAIKPSDVLQMCSDTNVHCRVAAAKLAGGMIDVDAVHDRLISLAGDSSQQVRFQVALSLADDESEQATSALTQLARRDGHDSAFADGLLTSLKQRSGAVLVGLMDDDSFPRSGDAGTLDLVRRLAAVVGARGNWSELRSVFESLGRDGSENWWRAAAIAGIGDGLPRYRGDRGRMTLPNLIAKPPAELGDSIVELKAVFDRSGEIAVDPEQAVADRVAAIELMAYQPFDAAARTFAELLSSGQPVQIQSACLEALQRNGSAGAAQIVLDRWTQLGPSVRGTAIAFLLRRTESTRLTLDAMSEGKMNPSALGIDQRVRLLKHADEALRDQATKLFGGVVSPNRQKVAKDYEGALAMTADAAHGKQVFTRVCASCHRISGEGHETGPDLTDVRNRSKPALLYDILDPNAKVEPRFTSYSILTAEGSVFTGLIESETSEAVILKMAEGKTKTIGRAEIDQMKASDVSLMPEGIEKDISPQQMADLLAYLKDR